MKQLSKHYVNKLEKKPKATHDVNKELKFSKSSQASGKMPWAR